MKPDFIAGKTFQRQKRNIFLKQKLDFWSFQSLTNMKSTRGHSEYELLDPWCYTEISQDNYAKNNMH